MPMSIWFALSTYRVILFLYLAHCYFWKSQTLRRCDTFLCIEVLVRCVPNKEFHSVCVCMWMRTTSCWHFFALSSSESLGRLRRSHDVFWTKTDLIMLFLSSCLKLFNNIKWKWSIDVKSHSVSIWANAKLSMSFFCISGGISLEHVSNNNNIHNANSFDDRTLTLYPSYRHATPSQIKIHKSFVTKLAGIVVVVVVFEYTSRWIFELPELFNSISESKCTTFLCSCAIE